MVGGRETGRAAADHRHTLAGLSRRWRKADAVFQRPIADVVLDGVDADPVLDFVAIATVLAGCRAHPAHHRRERIGGGHAAEGIFLPRRAIAALVLPARDRQPAPNVVPRRTRRLTRRGLVHVGRAFVRPARLKDFLLPRQRRRVAIGVATEGQAARLFRCRLRGHRDHPSRWVIVAASRAVAEPDRPADELVQRHHHVHLEPVIG